MTDKPFFENAPGIVVRQRADKTWAAWWQCRSDIAQAGFTPKIVPLWRGSEPSDADRALVSDACNSTQTEMLAWSRDWRMEQPVHGEITIRNLIHRYRTDPDSRFQKIRFHSRENYSHFLKRIEIDHGDKLIKDIRARDVMRWHEEWSKRGVAMASGLVGHLRSILTFGATLLECPHCTALKAKLADMKFPQGKPREEVLTADMVIAIRERANSKGARSAALAQAIQFEGMFRQKDIIGEWVPNGEPGMSDVFYTAPKNREVKWLRGLRWEEIDDNLILTHVTSKRQKEIAIRLLDAPMVVEELRLAYPGCVTEKEVVHPETRKVTTVLVPHRELLPASGPVIVSEVTNRPYTSTFFRHTWRTLATEVGIPKSIRNQDSRAGAISEATDGGADMEHVRQAATHSDVKMTSRYSRNAADKTAKVLQIRVAHRGNKSGT